MMKNIFKISALVCFIYLQFGCVSKRIKTEENTLVIIDNLNFPRQKKFQDFTDLLVKNKYISLSTEPRVDYDLLNTVEKAEIFAKNLATIKFPNSKIYIEKYIKVSQDRSGQLWFVSTSLAEPGTALDSQLSMIFFKSDCKVVHFSNHF